MTYTDKSAVDALNSYVWKLVEANLGWNKNNYNGLVPIIPVNQQPELMQTARPFLVFGSARHPAGHLYSLIKEAVSFTVYSTDLDEATRVINLLANTFDRQDEAAADVNGWLGTFKTGSGYDFGTSFASVRTVMTEKPDAAEQEGGYYSGLIMIEMLYTQRPNNTIVTSGFTYVP